MIRLLNSNVQCEMQMSSGEVHNRWHKIGLVVVLPASIFVGLFGFPLAAIAFTGGYVLGRWISPDWDSVAITKDESNMVHDFKFLGYLFVGYTTIYGFVFRKMHRSFFTHFPGVSTAIRLLFVFWWVYFAIDILYDWQVAAMISVWVGLSLSDLVHYVLDSWF